MTNIGDPLSGLSEYMCIYSTFFRYPPFAQAPWSLERQSLVGVPNIDKRLAYPPPIIRTRYIMVEFWLKCI